MSTKNGLTLWNQGFAPIGALHREMDRFINDFWALSAPSDHSRTGAGEWIPACDIEEADNYFLLTLDMPGVQKDQIKIELQDKHLVVSGERARQASKSMEQGWYSERQYGKFQRSFALSAAVDAEKIEASYEDGTLKIYVPKAEAAKPRTIKVNASGASAGFFGKLLGSSALPTRDAD